MREGRQVTVTCSAANLTGIRVKDVLGRDRNNILDRAHKIHAGSRQGSGHGGPAVRGQRQYDEGSLQKV